MRGLSLCLRCICNNEKVLGNSPNNTSSWLELGRGLVSCFPSAPLGGESRKARLPTQRGRSWRRGLGDDTSCQACRASCAAVSPEAVVWGSHGALGVQRRWVRRGQLGWMAVLRRRSPALTGRLFFLSCYSDRRRHGGTRPSAGGHHGVHRIR